MAKGISIWNFNCILLLTFANNHCYKIEGTFSTLLLQDKTYYNVDVDNLANTMATYKTIVYSTFIIFSFFGRFIYDTWSYRTLIPISAFTASLCVFLIPWGHSVYPGLLIIQFILTLSLFLENLNPMMVDYVQNKSKGLASSYNKIMSTLPKILYAFCYVYILDWTDNLLVPIYIIACINTWVFIYLLIYVKNVKKQRTPLSAPR